MEKLFTFKKFLIGSGLIIFDLVIYIFLGLMMMGYDDFYDEIKGEYWSLASMTFWQKVNFISLNLWSFLNIILIGYLIYRIVKNKLS